MGWCGEGVDSGYTVVPMRKAPRIAKELMRDIISEQPDGSSFDDILRKLAFHRMVERGLADAGRGKSLTTDQLRQRIKTWSS